MVREFLIIYDYSRVIYAHSRCAAGKRKGCGFYIIFVNSFFLSATQREYAQMNRDCFVNNKYLLIFAWHSRLFSLLDEPSGRAERRRRQRLE
jgi:hypothetical protein